MQAVTEPLRPVQGHERIQTLDVIRGFALLGIFLMNVEWFNRPIAELGSGVPAGLAGLDHAVAWLIHTFVSSKFWPMFSLLFGMGFAVMLQRARAKGSAFVATYARRTAALAAFGLLHGVLVWPGDILFAYAVTAAALLLTLFGKPKHWLVLLVPFVVLAAIPATSSAGVVIALLVFSALVALYLRDERMIRGWPRIALLILVLAVLMVAGGSVAVAMAGADKGAPFIAGGLLLAVVAWLARRSREPADRRPLRAGVAIFLLPTFMMLAGAMFFMFGPSSQGASSAGAQAAGTTVAAAADKASPAASSRSTPDPKEARRREAAKQRAERKAEAAEETRVMTGGSYAEAMRFRARTYLRDLGNNVGLAIIALGLFLLGGWFIQSGMIVQPQRHLPAFRKLAVVGMVAGGVLSIAASLIALRPQEGLPVSTPDAQWMLANALHMMGGLPLMLGYVASLVLALQTPAGQRLLGWLAPAGRMALTNYLMQSVIASAFFYGYGLGHWGMPRAQQALFVLVVFALQVLLSHWWLARFRYGPMEWLWRWMTYGTRPALRLPAPAVA
jgi:uncharacterized membrane protein YeiB